MNVYLSISSVMSQNIEKQILNKLFSGLLSTHKAKKGNTTWTGLLYTSDKHCNVCETKRKLLCRADS